MKTLIKYKHDDCISWYYVPMKKYDLTATPCFEDARNFVSRNKAVAVACALLQNPKISAVEIEKRP